MTFNLSSDIEIAFAVAFVVFGFFYTLPVYKQALRKKKSLREHSHTLTRMLHDKQMYQLQIPIERKKDTKKIPDKKVLKHAYC